MNAHTPFDAKQDWTNPYCQNSSNDPMVDALLGNAYHVVRTVYCNLGNLKLIYDFLNQYGMVLGVQSEAELKALTTKASFVRIYDKTPAGDRQVTDYLYVEGDRTGILPDDTTATGSWVKVATSGTGGSGGESTNGGGYIPWVYNSGSANGGETTIRIPDETAGAPFMIVNGDWQTEGYDFEYDPVAFEVSFTTPLEPGDFVVVMRTGVPATPDNPNVSDWVTINWLYNQGAAVGGEQVIDIPYTFQSVPAVYKNGLRFHKGLTNNSYTIDSDNNRIILTEPLATNDRLIVQLGGEAKVLEIVDHTIQEVARAANVKDSEVILSTDTTQVLNSKKVIFDVVTQRIYGLPTLPTNVYINAVSNGQLTYSPGNITVDLVPLPNSAELLSNNLMSSTGSSFIKHGDKTVGEILDTLSSVQLHYSAFSSLTELHDYIVNNSLTNVDIIFDKVLTLGPGSGGLGTLFVLSDMKHLGIHNLIIEDTLLYSGSFDLTRVFDLTNIGNLYMEVDASSTLEYVGDDKRGLTPLRLNGCDNFTFIGKTSKCYQGYECTNVKNLHARSVNNDTRYPHLLGNVGTVDIHTVNNGCRRDFFLTNNCAGGQITVDAVDTQQGTPIKMYFYNGNMDNQISNLTINYKYRSTGRYTLPYRVAPIWLDWGWDSTITESMIAGLMRNITINYDVVGGNWGSVIGTTKLIDESVADNNPRGYGYSNIVITGRIELGGGDSNNHAWFFNFNSNDNWASGDSINGFTCRDLVVRKLNGGDVYVNTNQLTGAVTNYGGVKFEGVSAPEAKLTATDYSKVKFANCTFSDFASLGAATDSSKCATGSLLFIKAAGNPGKFKLGTVSTYRNVSLWTVDIVANSPLSGVSSAWHGRLQGTLAMATTPAASTMEGSVQSTFTKGTAATPTISVDASGNVFLNFDGWDALEANVAVNVKMQYDEYSGGGNKTVRGMLSKANGGFSLNLS